MGAHPHRRQRGVALLRVAVAVDLAYCLQPGGASDGSRLWDARGRRCDRLVGRIPGIGPLLMLPSVPSSSPMNVLLPFSAVPSGRRAHREQYSVLPCHSSADPLPASLMQPQGPSLPPPIQVLLSNLLAEFWVLPAHKGFRGRFDCGEGFTISKRLPVRTRRPGGPLGRTHAPSIATYSIAVWPGYARWPEDRWCPSAGTPNPRSQALRRKSLAWCPVPWLGGARSKHAPVCENEGDNANILSRWRESRENGPKSYFSI
jgi:hypothetical protein